MRNGSNNGEFSLRAIVPNEEWKQKLIRFLQTMDESRNEESEKGAVLRTVKFLMSSGWKSASVKEVTQRVCGSLPCLQNPSDSFNTIVPSRVL